MATAKDAGQMLKELADVLNSKNRTRKKIAKWISESYYGKVISWNFGDQSYHLVFMKDGSVKWKEGEYPASETILMTDPDTWFGICTMTADMKNVMRDKKLKLRGNFHEFFALYSICVKYWADLGQKYVGN